MFMYSPCYLKYTSSAVGNIRVKSDEEWNGWDLVTLFSDLEWWQRNGFVNFAMLGGQKDKKKLAIGIFRQQKNSNFGLENLFTI